MLIKCENCGTKFSLDEKLLKPTGSKVRCSSCKTIFVAYPSIKKFEPTKIDLSKKIASSEVPEKIKIQSEDLKAIKPDTYAEVKNTIESVQEEKAELDKDSDLEIAKIKTEELTDAIEEKLKEEKLTEKEESKEPNQEEFEEEEEEEEEEVVEEEIEEEYEEVEEEVEDEEENSNKEEKNQININVDEEVIEEEEIEEENNNVVTKDNIEALKQAKEKEIRKKESKTLIIAGIFAAILLAVFMYGIYYLHYLTNTRGVFSLADFATTGQGNNVEVKDSTLVGSIKDFAKDNLSKEEQYPDLVPIPSTVSSMQRRNYKIGYIRIITGTIINKTNKSYKVIKIKGTLSTETEPKAREEIVVCGNILTRDEVQNFDLESIKSKLMDEKSAAATAPLLPNEKRDFFIVFYNLPNEIKDYHLNVISAEPHIEEAK